ncbi:hypothetical protein WICMUC_004239 [Wickerhamomyces mucosus]|uniref:FAD-binding FR-type domain-containing protein n=1 Tax=Wickerhamomyces mucosus TaxID=1378264 RepID=A0A9P8PHG0_9ASCO|nr:hypothetical protein WICMUC_004239 [Wickerhamomyces mucosus]
MKLSLAFSLIFVGSALSASITFPYSDDDYILSSCKASLFSTALFSKKDTAKSYTAQCSVDNQPALGSMIWCLYNETSIHDSAIENSLIATCKKNKISLTVEDLRDSYENVTKYITTTNKISGFNKSIPIHQPVKYSSKVYNNAYKSTAMRYDNINYSFYVGFSMIGYWFVIFIVSAFIQLGAKIGLFNNGLFNNRLTKFGQKHLTYPALVGKTHTDPLKFGKSFLVGLIPTRLESILIFVYFVYVILTQSIGIYHFFAEDTIWKTKDGQLGRYVGDRAGVTVTFGFLLSFLLAGRNNFLLWFTGIKYSTFNMYHRWISRINLLLLLVHAIAMNYQSLGIGKFQSRVLTDWYQAGIVASIFGGFIFVFSAYWFRYHHYEVFLLSHFALVLGFLVGSAIHLHDFGYYQFTACFAAFWGFDRIARIARLIAFGSQKSKVQVISKETLKLTIPKRKFWRAPPGSYGYVHFLTKTAFFQSHPFSLIEEDANTVTMHVKIKGGVTSHIHKLISAKPNQEGYINISIEGPYGDSKPLHKYDTALLYAGGNGIPSLYAYAKHLAETRKNHIKLYWVLRNWHSLDWFDRELLKLKDLPITTIIYISKPDSPIGTKFSDKTDSSSVSSKEDTGNEKIASETDVITKLFDFVEFRYGRPDIKQLVREDIVENGDGNTAIMTVGHTTMADDIRQSVSQSVGLAKGQVDYYEELQTF